MAREDAIDAVGKIVEVLSDKLYWVELVNGHRLLAHVSGRRRSNFERMSLGDVVEIRMSPYDLSKGCINVRDE
jgi:translation initiation factor IF-1